MRQSYPLLIMFLRNVLLVNLAIAATLAYAGDSDIAHPNTHALYIPACIYMAYEMLVKPIYKHSAWHRSC